MQHDGLLIDLYTCPGDPGRWAHVLDMLCQHTGACSAVIQAFRLDGEAMRPQWQVMDHRTGRHHTLPQARYAATLNPRLARHRSLRVLNRVVGDEEIFERDDPEKTRLQHELAGLGLGTFLGSLQPVQDDLYLGVALHRSLGEADDFSNDAVRLLGHLAPHVRQAWTLARQLQTSELRWQTLQCHLDQLRCGLIACDSTGRVQWMNHSARTQLARTPHLRLQGGTLLACGSGTAPQLRAELAQAGDAVRFLSLGRGDDALHLALRASHLPQGPDGTPERCILVALTSVGDALAVPTQAWARLLGVTAAEAGLVATLAGGGTVELHAQRRGVAAGTVRCQLKQVLAKTGTHRQAELVRLALSSAAAHVLDTLPALSN